MKERQFAHLTRYGYRDFDLKSFHHPNIVRVMLLLQLQLTGCYFSILFYITY